MKIRAFPYIPIRNGVFFPGSSSVLSVGRESSIKALEAATARRDKSIVLLSQVDADIDQPGLDHLGPVGVWAVVKTVRGTGQELEIVVEGKERVRLRDIAQHPHNIAQVEILGAPTSEDSETEHRLHQELLTQSTRLFQVSGESGTAAAEIAAHLEEPTDLISFLASVLTLPAEDGRAVLQAERLEDAQRLVLSYLERRLSGAEDGGPVALVLGELSWSSPAEQPDEEEDEDEVEDADGDDDDDDSYGPAAAEMLRERLKELELPPDVLTAVGDELGKLERFDVDSVEFQNVLVALNMFFEFPWNLFTVDNVGMRQLRLVLDQHLHALESAKEQLTDRLAVLKSGGSSAGFLCLCGPPGTGKKAIALTVAEALGRRIEFLRLEKDDPASQLRGRIWNTPAASPGLLFRYLRKSGVQNPILVFEQDELTESQAKALLDLAHESGQERDDYLGLPLDFSHILIVITTKSLELLPGHLQKRLEPIFLSGYTTEQKASLVRRHVLPELVKGAGLAPGELEITEPALLWLIQERTAEVGVSDLCRVLGQVVARMVRIKAEGKEENLVCTLDLVQTWWESMKRPVSERTAPGQVSVPGLTLDGAKVLGVEALTLPDSTEFVVTGSNDIKLRDTVVVVRSLLLSRASSLGFNLRTKGLHVHLPGDLVGSDREGIGLALAVAVASAYSHRTVQPGVGVLGQISLTGRVGWAEGLIAKLVAAREAGLEHLILPLANRDEVNALPEALVQGFQFSFVNFLEEALTAAIPELVPPVDLDRDTGGFQGLRN
jgi:ATP-dependent Lon protease